MTAHFPPDAVSFLKQLSSHNDRAWFETNKLRFKDSIETPSKGFLDAAIPALSKLFGEAMGGKVFRIHRDVRFSKDKTPYNTHVRMLFHGPMSSDSECGVKPALYFSLESDKVLAGVGSMEFARPVLDAYRAAVVDTKRGPALETLLAKLTGAKGSRIDAPELKRVPAGFDPGHPRGDLLRRKGLALWHEFPTKAVTEPAAIPNLLAHYKEMKPLYDWINAL